MVFKYTVGVSQFHLNRVTPITYNYTMDFSCIFFDLDDTLYPHTNGVWASIRQRMNDYMKHRLGLPDEQVSHLRRSYFETYGTTLRGLQIHYDVNPDDFLEYVHDLPIDEIIQPDPTLREILLNFPQKRWILTNSDSHHANRVIDTLGLNGCFHGVIDIRALGFICKPDPEAYRIALRIADEEDPRRCVYLDDSPRNLTPARKMGFFTVLVSPNGNDPSAFLTIHSPHELSQRLPELFPMKTDSTA